MNADFLARENDSESGASATIRFLALVAVLAPLVVAGGCQAVRKVTYPADFTYLESAQIRGAMQDLASQVRLIDTELATGESLTPRQREIVIAALARMESTSTRLGAGSQATNHLFIDEHIDEFRNQIRRARSEAEAEPPSYYRAGLISGNCLACHRLR